MTRRDLLACAAASSLFGFESMPNTLGASPTTFRNRRRSYSKFDIIEHCHQLGLKGAESILKSGDAEAAVKIRRQVDSYGMRVILNIPLPKRPDDLDKFDSDVKAAKNAGAESLHAAMTDRRYEQFDSLAQFQQNFAQCQRTIELAEPILRKQRMRLAIENHKGWRAEEQSAWMKRVASEWVGVCLDMGNNLSLCELPDETFETLTPFTFFTHMKDMGLQEYSDGFLLSEVPFGRGIIDLKKRVAQLRSKDPNMLFCIEMITRDPLKIPVFTDKYWATFSTPETQIPGRDVAQTIALVDRNSFPGKLPLPDKLGLDAEVQAEDQNNLVCIQYAREQLGF